MLLKSLKAFLHVCIFLSEFLVETFDVVVVGGVEVEVEIEFLFQAFALLGCLALKSVGEFACLLNEGGDLFL